MPWLETNVVEERVRFVAEALAGTTSMSALCRKYGVSRPTGYKWLVRFRATKDASSLQDRSRRPRHCPHQTPAAVEERVVALRRRHGWSGKKLATILARDDGINLARSTIDQIIKRRGLIRREDQQPPACRRFVRPHPNDAWQVDFKGAYWLSPSRECHPLSVLDDHSRYVVGLTALGNERTRGVQRALRGCFERVGLPKQMLFDRGVPWWSTQSSLGLTRLGVWLIKQNIKLIFGTPFHPQSRGKIERFHRSLKRRVRELGRPTNLTGFQRLFDHLTTEHNEIRPHESLDLEVPASCYEPSPRRYCRRPRAWDYPTGCLTRRVRDWGIIHHQSKDYFVSEALAGEWVGCHQLDEVLVVTYRSMVVRQINLRTGRTTAVVRPMEDIGL